MNEKNNQPNDVDAHVVEKQTAGGLEIQIDDLIAQGVYSNGMMINFNENEFAIDFLYVQPTHPKAKVRSRVIVTPGQTRRFLQLLQENVQRYDNRFGRQSRIGDNSGPAAAGRQGGPPIH